MPDPDRATYLGGHDAGPALGLAPFGKTRFRVWEEKTGRSHSAPSSWRMEKGLRMEPLLCQWYEAQRNCKVANRDEFMRHAAEPIIAGHPDGIATSDGSRLRLVEFKDTKRREYWTEAPQDYISQCQHYGAILKSIHGDMLENVVDIVVDHGAAEPSIFQVELDTKSIDHLVECERNLWYEHIAKDVPPEPENVAECLALWPQSTDEVMTATPDIILALEQLAAIRSQMAKAKAKKEDIELEIKRRMGAAGTLLWEGRKVATWTNTKGRRSVDTEALKQAGLYDAFSKVGESYRTFRPKDITEDQARAAREQISEVTP